MLAQILQYKKYLARITGVVFLVIFYIFLYKIYLHRVNAFGCFDDCFNFMGGYFLLHHKQLYSEIFYNHAPGMAYISTLIQFLTHPQNLYDLVLKHHQAVLFFGLVMNLLFFIRFGYPMLAFSILYELTKFYVFGDRFLAEGIIVYPLIYLANIVFQKTQGKILFFADYIFIGVAVWFVVWMREPYIPLALLFFAILYCYRKDWKKNIISFSIFLFLSLVTLFYHNISELFFNVYTTNLVAIIPSQTLTSNFAPTGLFTIFFYPFLIFFEGQKTFLHTLEIIIGIFFAFFCIMLVLKRQWKLGIWMFLILAFANARYTLIGKEYYEAFHQIVWYSLFIFFAIVGYSLLSKTSMKVVWGIGFITFVLFIFFSKSSFWYQKIDPYQEFITNYGNVLQAGEIIQTLSQPSDTLFVDGYDDMVYWVSQRYSSYKYSWYTSLMPSFQKYTKAREQMFAKNPSDFYYGSCLKNDIPQRRLSTLQQNLYVRLLEDAKPSCIWVKKTKLLHISQQQWNNAKKGYYTLPNSPY